MNLPTQTTLAALCLLASPLLAEDIVKTLDRGPNHEAVESVSWQVDLKGAWAAETNVFTVVSPGMNVLTGEGWIPAQPRFSLDSLGNIHSEGAQVQVTVANGLSLITVTLPDGQQMFTRPLALQFFDPASQKSLTLGSVRATRAELLDANTVIFRDCFEGAVSADLIYELYSDHFSQDLLLRSQLPGNPNAYGLGDGSTRIELWTEVLGASAEPRRSRRSLPGIPLEDEADDYQLDFSSVVMPPGKAFLKNVPGDAMGEEIPVSKSWTTVNGENGPRHFLIEGSSWASLSPMLAALPTSGNSDWQPVAQKAKGPRRIPALAQVPKGIQIASMIPKSAPMLCLDYSIVVAATNFTFQGNSTYLFPSTVNTVLSGTTTILPGAVIKITNGASVTLNGPVNAPYNMFRPVVVTSWADDSVGEKITGSTGNGSTNLYSTGLSLDYNANGNALVSLANFRFNFGQVGLSVANFTGGDFVLDHGVFVNCQTAIKPTSSSMKWRNGLANNVSNVFQAYQSTVRGEYITANGATNFNNQTGTPSTYYLTNSLITAVTTMGITGGSLFSNAVQIVASAAGIYTNVGAGSHYFLNNTYRGVGVSNAPVVDIQKRTTYAPLVWAGSITSATNITPVATRDTNAKDLGWHAAPMDFALSGIALSSTLTFSNGTVLGIYGGTGLVMQASSVLQSDASPLALNEIVRYQAVQEQPITWSNNPTIVASLTANYSPRPAMNLRFTEISGLGGKTLTLLDNGLSGINNFVSVGLTDCQLLGTKLSLQTASDPSAVNVGITNSLFEYSTLTLARTYSGDTTAFTVNLFNNLFYGGSVSLTLTSAGTNPTWTIRDNAFDGTTLSASQNVGSSKFVNDHNGYVNVSVLTASGGSDVSVSAFDYDTGVLSRFYQNSTSFLQKGSRPADQAGLWAYTVLTNSTPQTNSMVTIGAAFVALGASGNPQDKDGDGTPDYREAPPVITLPAGTFPYVENDPPRLFLTNSVVSDPDSSDFNGGSLRVEMLSTAFFQDSFFINNEGTGAGQIGVSGSTVTYGGVTIGSWAGGRVTVPLVVNFTTASATIAAAQALIRNITYSNETDNPNVTTRTVRVGIDDGDGAFASATRQLSVTAVNDAPVVQTSATALTYETGIVAMDANATVLDVDSGNFSGGSLIADLKPYFSEDAVSVVNQGTGAGQIGVSGNTISYQGATIGTFSTTSNVMTFTFTTTSATPAAVQALVRALTYQNTAGSPSLASRLLSLTLDDGDGGTSATATRSINMACAPSLDVMLLIDNSISMSNYLADAKSAAISFLGYLDATRDQAGVVCLSPSNAVLSSSLGTAFATCEFVINSQTSSGAIAMDSQIGVAQTELEGVHHEPMAAPMIVLLSNGKQTPTAPIISAAMAAKQAGTRIVCIALGTNSDPALLTALASSSGDYYYASNSASLCGVYSSIAATLCRKSNPTADAGPDQTLTTNSVTLTGILSDDLCNATISWTIDLAPAGVTFSSTNTLGTTVTLAAPGIYVLRLSANNGFLSASDTITLNYAASVPILSAGPDRTIWTNATAALTGVLLNSGTLSATMSYGWSNVITSAGTVTFVNKNLINAGATFTNGGVFTLRLSATNSAGLKSYADMRVTVVDPKTRTWTKNVDFSEGTAINLSYDVTWDQLQLSPQATALPFVYVPQDNPDGETILRVDINSGVVLGEYFFAGGLTRDAEERGFTVDRSGNFWALTSHYGLCEIGVVIGGTRGNRIGGSPPYTFQADPNGQYLAPPFKYNTCIDRDGDGLIKTSRGLGNVLSWDDPLTSDWRTAAEDEAIIKWMDLGLGEAYTIIADANNDIWVVGLPLAGGGDIQYAKYRNSDGAQLTNFLFSTYMPNYTPTFDAQGNIWVPEGYGVVQKFTPSTGNLEEISLPVASTLLGGMIFDVATSNLWVSSDEGLVRLDMTGTQFQTYPHITQASPYMVLDRNNQLWIPPWGGNYMPHLTTSGTWVGDVLLQCGAAATMSALDSNGKIWVLMDNRLYRINPARGFTGQNGAKVGAVDLKLDLPYVAGNNYNYGDLSGVRNFTWTSPSGSWTVLHDSGVTNQTWGVLKWTTVLTNDPQVTVSYRATNSLASFTNLTFRTATNGTPFSATGRYVEIRVTMTKDATTNQPALLDLTLSAVTNVVIISSNVTQIAVDDLFEIFRDSTNQVLSVLTNDVPPSGTSLTIVSNTVPSNGRLINTGTSFLYTPNDGFVGLDRFSYVVTDGSNGFGKALVRVRVGDFDPAQPPPSATNDSFTVTGDFNAISGPTLLSILGNDKTVRTNFVYTNNISYKTTPFLVPVGDPAGNPVLMVGFTKPQHGFVQIDDCTNVAYTPVSGYAGPDSFDYMITSDGKSISQASVFLTVLTNVYLSVGKSVTNTLIATNAFQLLHPSLTNEYPAPDGYNIPHNPVYADRYLYNGRSGDTIALTIGSGVTVAVADPKRVLLSALNGPGTLTVSLPSTGTYVVEVASTTALANTTYTLATTCTTNTSAAIEVWNGTNQVRNGGLVDLGVYKLNATNATISLTVSNVGGANLTPKSGTVALNNFWQTQAPGATVAANNSTTVKLAMATNVAGVQTGTLYLTNNDAHQGLFTINLTGIITTTNYAVTITNPPSGSLFTVPASVELVATSNIPSSIASTIDFIASTAGGVSAVATAPVVNGRAVAVWRPNEGTYQIQARLTDGSSIWSISSPVSIQVLNSRNNSEPAANPDTKTINANLVGGTVKFPIDVLANDFDPDGDPLTIDSFTQGTSGLGRISQTGNVLYYTPTVLGIGDDQFYYTITDGRGAYASARVSIVALNAEPPTNWITAPIEGATFALPTNITISVTATNGNGNPITKVEFWADGFKIGESVSAPYSFVWKNMNVGDSVLTAVVRDTGGYFSVSTPVHVHFTGKSQNNLPTAAISNLNPTISAGTGLAIPITIRDGTYALTGTATDADGTDQVRYQVLLFDPKGNYVANALPGGTLDSWTTNRVTSGSLGTLNLSRFQNGAYDVVLQVSDQYTIRTDTKRIILDSEMKIGMFSFSQEDLVLPVSGIPLTVVRTYNSFNTASGDFGYGWTYSVKDMEAQIDEERSYMVDLDGSEALVRTGGGWDVTLTLPDGRRTTFVFNLIPTIYPDNNGLAYDAVWLAEPGVTAKLKTASPTTGQSLGDNSLMTLFNLEPYWGAAGLGTPWQNFDFPKLQLVLEDGTTFELERPDQGDHFFLSDEGSYSYMEPKGDLKLARIKQRSGDRIEFADSLIQHYDAQNNPTRSIKFQRDDDGRIIGITDPSGVQVVKYAYTNGNLVAVYRLSDNSNPLAPVYDVTLFQYTNSVFPHYITSIKDPQGVTPAINEYNADGTLKRHIDPDGRSITYSHDTTNRVETVTDRLGNPIGYLYDTRGNVVMITNLLSTNWFLFDTNNFKIAETNALLQATWFRNDTNGHLLYVTNALQGLTSYSYNSNGQVLVTFDPLNHGTTNQYDGAANLTSSTDALGKTTVYKYDSRNRLIATVDPLGNVSTNVYDALGNLTSTEGRDANWVKLTTTTYAYDNNGNQTNRSLIRTIPGGTRTNVTTLIYDSQNRIIKTIEPDGKTNVTTYSQIGKVQSTTSKLGKITSFAYDKEGNASQTFYPDGSNEAIFYDAEGHQTNTVDRLGHSTRYFYDPLGRLARTLYADGSTNFSFFDAAGRVSSSVSRGATNTFLYDAVGRRTNSTDSLGNKLHFMYDAAGNQTNVLDSLSHNKLSKLDALNRATNVVFFDGSKIFTAYDAGGRKILETDQNTNSTGFGYDGLGRLIAVTNAVGGITKYGYDEAGNQTNQVDALSRITAFEFDSMGRRTKRTLPGLQSENALYDALGNLTNKVDFKSQTINYIYDINNRLTQKKYPDGTSVSFSYNTMGWRTSMTDALGTTTYDYDVRGRRTKKVTPVGTLTYKWDNNGNLTNLSSSTANGTSTTYKYDVLNRLTNVVDRYGSNTFYSFDPVGNLKVVYFPAGVSNVYSYDSLNRLTNLVIARSTNQASFFYQLGLTGSRTNLTELSGRKVAYNYDKLYRLTNETVSSDPSINGTLGYFYDSVGNRTNRTGSLGSLGAVVSGYNTNDWLTGDTYDNNGNTTLSGGIADQYDCENRLTNHNAGAVLLVYDGDGNRVKKTTGSGTTYFLIDDLNPTGYPQVVEELTTIGSTPTKLYTYGLDLISQRQGAGTTHYYGYDGQGSVRFLIDGAGAKADTYQYDAYGTLIASTGSTPNNYLFCGEYWDSDLGMYYLRARYFKPAIGRFWTMDSHEGIPDDPESLHKYLYCAADPVNRIDPSGNMSLPEISLTIGIQLMNYAPRIALAAGYVALVSANVYIWTGVAISVDDAFNDGALSDSLYALQDAAGNTFFIAAFAFDGASSVSLTPARPGQRTPQPKKTIDIPKSKYPASYGHWVRAQAKGKPALVQAGRSKTVQRRAASLAGIPRVRGMDRDEYPPAVFEEGGDGASVEYLPPSDNRGAGAVLGNALRDVQDGEWVLLRPVDDTKGNTSE
jgi:RHS repeat-associated protein